MIHFDLGKFTGRDLLGGRGVAVGGWLLGNVETWKKTWRAENNGAWITIIGFSCGSEGWQIRISRRI